MQKLLSGRSNAHTRAYILQLLPKISEYRTNTGAIVNPAEHEKPEQRLCYLTQAESFQYERKMLKSTPLGKMSKLAQFSPFIKPYGLLRASCRTKSLDVATFDVDYPILLDPRHSLVRLLLEHTHVQHCHQGVDYLRALIQQRLAGVKLRATLKQ